MAASQDSALTLDRALELTGTIIEAFAAGDVDDLGGTCSPTIHCRTPASDTHRFDELAESMRIEAFTGIDVAVDSLVVAGLGLAAEWRLRATHTGPLDSSAD